MKKIIETALIAAMILSMTACSKKGTSEDSSVTENDSETSAINQMEETSAGDSSKAEPEESPNNIWLAEQNFGTPSTSFEGTLFNDQAVLPLDLSVIDAYAAPYRFYPCNAEGSNQDSINEILTSDLMQEYSDKPAVFTNGTITKISVQTSYIEGTGWVGPTAWDDEYCGLGQICIENFSESKEELPISECYEKGWWVLYADESDNHPRFLQVEAGEDGKGTASNIIKKFGTPTYIASWWDDVSDLDNFISSMQEETIYYYSLIYEYDDFTLDIGIQEGFGELTILSAAYYPSAYWEVRKEGYEYLFSLK